MKTENPTEKDIPLAALAPADRAIGLKIAGGDLLLSGRFGQWMPLVLADGHLVSDAQPANDGDSGLATAQLIFDVTSNRNQSSSSGAPLPAADLFTFTATEVEPVGNQAYKLKGKLRAEGKTAVVEALLRSPPVHTPFCVIVFRLDQRRFPELWEALQARADGAGQGELRPTAWLRAPELAAA